MDHISHIASQGTFGLLSLIFYSIGDPVCVPLEKKKSKRESI